MIDMNTNLEEIGLEEVETLNEMDLAKMSLEELSYIILKLSKIEFCQNKQISDLLSRISKENESIEHLNNQILSSNELISKSLATLSMQMKKLSTLPQALESSLSDLDETLKSFTEPLENLQANLTKSSELLPDLLAQQGKSQSLDKGKGAECIEKINSESIGRELENGLRLVDKESNVTLIDNFFER